MKKLLTLLFLLFSFQVRADTGIFARTTCTSIPSPVTSQTWCFDMTDGFLKVWTGAAYTQITETFGSGILGVVNGGTGAATFTANTPILGNGTSPFTSGTVTGNTTKFATSTGTLTSGRCAQWDANGNIVQAAGACGGSPTFDLIGSGTNTTATMTVGTGASLTHSGSGSITATALNGLTASKPLVSDGSGNLATGSGFSGNTTTVVTTTGSQTSGRCVTIDANGNHIADSGACGIAGSGYGTIQDEGTPLTARTTMNFIGAGVTAADDGGNSRTNITIPGGMTALTGDVTASGTGSQAATIANTAVTLAKIQNAAANSKLLGSGASGSGASYSEITLGSGLTMTGTTLSSSASGGDFTKIETLTVGSAGTDKAFAATLDGDNDGIYELVGRVVSGNNGVDTNYTLQPNSTATSQHANDSSGQTYTTLQLCAAATGNSNKFCMFRITFFPLTGFIRTYTGTTEQLGTTQNTVTTRAIGGQWEDTSTNITSFNIHADQSSGIGVGSTFTLYKMAR